MDGKTIAVIGALIMSTSALQAQQPTTRPADSTKAMNKPSDGKKNNPSTGAMMDINTASRTELASAGWGQYADAIIAKRPYKNMNDLVEMKVVPQSAYNKGYEKFQIGNGSTSPMNDPKTPMADPQAPTADPKLNPTVPTTTPTTPPTTVPGTPVTPGAAGSYPTTTPAAPSPSGTMSPGK
jgi:hypothetical protein